MSGAEGKDAALLALVDVLVDCWEQFAIRVTPTGGTVEHLWDGGLSTLERLEGILGPLGILDDRGRYIPGSTPERQGYWADDDHLVEVCRPLLSPSPEPS